jgi:hydrogenase maturation protease
MLRTLILGYGNFDRQDDGVAWHILAGLNQRLGRNPVETPDDDFPAGEGMPDLLFVLQLIPELAETCAGYQRVCFVDAHTGALPHDLHQVVLQPAMQASPFTHHLTAETLLSMTQALYGANPKALLVSVRGYEFGFSQELSPRTQALAQEAVQAILRWNNEV